MTVERVVAIAFRYVFVTVMTGFTMGLICLAWGVLGFTSAALIGASGSFIWMIIEDCWSWLKSKAEMAGGGK